MSIDIIVTEPQRRVRKRLCAAVLANKFFEPKGGHFQGSTIEIDTHGNPIPGTEKLDPSLDFSIALTKWEGGVQTPTKTGMRMVTFNDPLTGKVYTISMMGIMAAMSEAVAGELARNLEIPV
jgi:hypothetical protein